MNKINSSHSGWVNKKIGENRAKITIETETKQSYTETLKEIRNFL